MKYLYPFLLIILFLSFSCNRTKTVQEVSENSDSVAVNSNRIVSAINETLIPNAKTALSDWKEYHNVDEFIIRYYNTSVFDALNNAKELSDLVKIMKDSIKVENLNQPSVIARFNVLHNQTLRLNDMSTIPSISDEEVKEEVLKIVEIYAAVNSKINTIYKAEDLQNLLEVDTEKPLEKLDGTKPIDRKNNRSRSFKKQ